MAIDPLTWDKLIRQVDVLAPDPAKVAVAVIMRQADVDRLMHLIPAVDNIRGHWTAPSDGLEVRSDAHAKAGGFTVEFADGHTEWFDFQEAGDG